jgi:hypothetical protein
MVTRPAIMLFSVHKDAMAAAVDAIVCDRADTILFALPARRPCIDTA